MDLKLGFLIKRLNAAHKEYVDAYLKQMDVTKAQLDVLVAVYKAEDKKMELSQRDLERNFHVSNPTMTGILNRLESKGLIQRVSSDKDKRMRMIHSTPKAQAMDRKLREVFQQADDCIVSGFSDQEIEQFINYLQRAYLNIKKEEEHD